ncbi:tetratricopeptide repeat protein, partial [bacterium]|nr:tetratricopeptide repeat protein [bacterium]
LAPDSPYSVDAAHYMAQAHLSLNEPEKAIKAYQESIRLDPYRDDSHNKLGNLYFSLDRNEDATTQYEAAARSNPDATNIYTLGQAYLNMDRLSDAETQFSKVAQMARQDPAGKFGLGLTFSRQGRNEEAIALFEEAISLKNDFYDAYAEMGYTYADMGQMDIAQELVDFLEFQEQADLADNLSRYMYKVDPPKIAYAQSASTFPFLAGINTPVQLLDAYLATPNATKTFTMRFQFDKSMDRESVENVTNWQIGRAVGSGPGQAYNFGMSIPSTEITISSLPKSVYYDADKYSATVFFNIRQNATTDGTIDPSHIEFRFTGQDVYGNKMDPDFDQYIGFSGTA